MSPQQFRIIKLPWNKLTPYVFPDPLTLYFSSSATAQVSHDISTLNGSSPSPPVLLSNHYATLGLLAEVRAGLVRDDGTVAMVCSCGITAVVASDCFTLQQGEHFFRDVDGSIPPDQAGMSDFGAVGLEGGLLLIGGHNFTQGTQYKSNDPVYICTDFHFSNSIIWRFFFFFS